MNWKTLAKDKRVWIGAAVVGGVVIFVWSRNGGNRQEADDGDQGVDYNLGYYLPGGSMLPIDNAGGGGSSDTTGALLALAEKSQQLQANQTYAGIASQFWANLSENLKSKDANYKGASGSLNIGGTNLGFDFTFKAPAAPVAQPSNNNATVNLVTKLFQGGNSIDVREGFRSGGFR